MSQNTKITSLLSKLFGGSPKKESGSCCNVRIEEVKDDPQPSVQDEGQPNPASASREANDGGACCKPQEPVRKAHTDE